MKTKFLSVVLALSLLLSVFAIMGITASAEGNEKTIITFDDSNERTGFARKEGSATNNPTSIAEVDGLSNPGGKVASIKLTNYIGWQIKLPPNWSEGKPTKIKMWAAVDQGSFTSVANSTGLSVDDNYPSSTGLCNFMSTGASTTGDWYEMDISNFTEAELATFKYITVKVQGVTNAPTVYMDNITLVYDKASDVPATPTWNTMYDWESSTTGAAKAGAQAAKITISSQTAQLKSFVTPSTKGLKVYNSDYVTTAANKGYCKIDMTSDIANAVSLRAALRFKTSSSSNPCFAAVVVDGVTYYSSLLTVLNNMSWFYLDYDRTYTAADSSTIKLTKENLSKVQSIMFTCTGTWDDAGLFIDDIEYATAASSTPTASFAKEDGTAGAADSQTATFVTFPTYTTTKSGFQFVGWSDGTKLYAAGDTATIAADTAYTAVSIKITTADTAAVRWSNTTDKAGLKFNTQIAADGFTKLIDLKAVSAASVGAEISKLNDFSANKITVSNDTSPNGESAGWLNTIFTDYFEFNSAAANYDKSLGDTSLIDTTLYARGYVTVTYADGGTATFYGAANAGASMKAIATAAYSSADDAHKAILTRLYDVTGE